MSRKHWGVAGTALGMALALGAWTVAAQDNPNPDPNKGTGKSIGETVDRVVQSVKEGTREAGESIREHWARARTSVHNMDIAARVYSRLHWDKALNDTPIDLDVKEDGVATLRGAVADARAKARALELAQDTLGVTQVVDHLTIRPATEEKSGTTTTTTKETVKTPSGTTTTTTKDSAPKP